MRVITMWSWSLLEIANICEIDTTSKKETRTAFMSSSASIVDITVIVTTHVKYTNHYTGTVYILFFLTRQALFKNDRTRFYKQVSKK